MDFSGMEKSRLCFERRKSGLSYPACCKREVCPGPEECGDPMFYLDDGTFIDVFSHQGVPFMDPDEWAKKEGIV